jgi:hypothetical protein
MSNVLILLINWVADQDGEILRFRPKGEQSGTITVSQDE